MSRRITFLLLAASAALITTQAIADPECFGDSCQLPGAAEPAAVAVQLPDSDEPAAPEAIAAVQKSAPAQPLPQVLTAPQVVAAPQDEPPQIARRPLPPKQSVVEQVSTGPEPARIAPRNVKDASSASARLTSASAVPPAQGTVEEVRVAREPARHAPRYLKDAPPERAVSAPRVSPAEHTGSVRVASPDPDYVVGHNAFPVGGVVVVSPGALYAGRPPVFMIAPSAKIISIDPDD